MTNKPINPELIQLRTALEQSTGSPSSRVEVLGSYVDLAGDARSQSDLDSAIQIGNSLLAELEDEKDDAVLNYLIANAWGSKARLSSTEKSEVWQWEQEEMEKELLHLRLAMASPAFPGLEIERQCQVLTNLANAMDVLGRSVEAVALYGRALDLLPIFAMTLGNRGRSLLHYGGALYDYGHAYQFLIHSKQDLEDALSSSDPNMFPAAEETFRTKLLEIEQYLEATIHDCETDLFGFTLGDSEEEEEYRGWCLEECLFLNPLNDLGAYPIAATDVLNTPSMTLPLGTAPYFIGFYNQLKQEYASARYFLYEGLTTPHSFEEGVHFSDRSVLLLDTGEFATHTLGMEKIKAAFRSIYSLFDKIAFFLNDYMELRIPENKVNFRTLWYAKQNHQRGLRAEFVNRSNWPMRGLFWLSKDLFENRPGFEMAIEPDAQKLSLIRNLLEHRYLKVLDVRVELVTGVLGEDSLGVSIERSDFERKSLKLLKLARSALIYLTLGIRSEEMERGKSKDSRLRIPMQLPTIDDRFRG